MQNEEMNNFIGLPSEFDDQILQVVLAFLTVLKQKKKKFLAFLNFHISSMISFNGLS